MELTIKWSSKEIPIKCTEDDTVATLKRKIQEETHVQPKRQNPRYTHGEESRRGADTVARGVSVHL